MPSSPRTLLLLALAVLAPAGCRWAYPAHPGARLAPVSAAVPAAAAGGGADALYRAHCGRCHAPYPPTHLPPGAWPSAVARFGPRAGLFGADRARVLAWLQAEARRAATSGASGRP